jgi:hypothetical protein
MRSRMDGGGVGSTKNHRMRRKRGVSPCPLSCNEMTAWSAPPMNSQSAIAPSERPCATACWQAGFVRRAALRAELGWQLNCHPNMRRAAQRATPSLGGGNSRSPHPTSALSTPGRCPAILLAARALGRLRAVCPTSAGLSLRRSTLGPARCLRALPCHSQRPAGRAVPKSRACKHAPYNR